MFYRRNSGEVSSRNDPGPPKTFSTPVGEKHLKA
jgi:hypothetical protein